MRPFAEFWERDEEARQLKASLIQVPVNYDFSVFSSGAIEK
jgi:hypothetical protein